MHISRPQIIYINQDNITFMKFRVVVAFKKVKNNDQIMKIVINKVNYLSFSDH